MSEFDERRKAWVAALRSGVYKQGSKVLCSLDGSMCCLGVATDLYLKEKGLEWKLKPGSSSIVSLYLGPSEDGYYASKEVRDWLGLRTNRGAYSFHDDGEPSIVYSLAYQNDGGRTFSEIADIIEERAKDLFND